MIDTEQFAPVLEKCVLFAGMEKETVTEYLFLMDTRSQTYEKGSFVHRAGDCFDRFGLVLSGRVDVLLDDIEGNRTMMAHVGAGGTFGESLCLLQQKNTDVYAIAGEGTHVLWFSVAPILAQQQGELTLRFLRMLAKRTLAMNNRIQILSKLTLREKLIAYFTFTAKEQCSRQVVLSMNREDLATYMGTNRSALCRELSAMQREGLIAYRKNSFVLKFGMEAS